MGRPPSPVKRTVRSLRLDDEQWTLLRKIAFQQNQSPSEVARKAINDFLASYRIKEENLDISALVSDTAWYEEHRVPVHGGMMPLRDQCTFCDLQYDLRGWSG